MFEKVVVCSGALLCALGGTSIPDAQAEQMLVDPTRPFSVSDSAASGTDEAVQSKNPLRVQAIYFVAGRYSALIEGHRLNIGDDYQGYRVQEIDWQSVELSKSGDSLVLRMGGVAVKQPSREEE